MIDGPSSGLLSRRGSRVPAAAAGPRRGVAYGLGADLLAVVAFVLIGRRAHGEGLDPAGAAGTLWPFLAGVMGGWIGIRVFGLPPASVRAAGMVWVKTLVIGVALRSAVAGDATPPAFIAVAALSLAVLLGGWRALLRLALRRRRPGPDARVDRRDGGDALRR